MLKLQCTKLKYVENTITLTFKRFKNRANHWSVIRKKVTVGDKALSHLDEFYTSCFEERWPQIKRAIVKPNKYVALVNNFGDDLETMEHLEKIGSVNLKDIYENRREILKYKASGEPNIIQNENNYDIENRIAEIAQQLTQEEFDELYGQTQDMSPPRSIDTGGAVLENLEVMEEVKYVANSGGTTEEEIDNYEESRIIHPEMGLSSVALWNYVPATKLKGKEDWLPESHQFQYYLSAKDFQVTTEEEEIFDIPQYLNVYSFNMGETKKFFEPKAGKAGVANYYLMDGASVLPVLALNPQRGDRVLDMCAAPGGKTLLLLQTMMPGLVFANDKQLSRVNRIHKVLNEYLYDYSNNTTWSDRVIVTRSDGRHIKDELGFDKILVDVPCTADRHSVRDNIDNIFKPSRLKERLKLPELQSDLLCNALKLCKVGGTVVYSTCTLSPLQNDGVVNIALKKANKLHKIEATVKLFTNSILPLRGLYHFGEGTLATKYGHLVVPHLTANFGPAYFSTIVRNK